MGILEDVAETPRSRQARRVRRATERRRPAGDGGAPGPAAAWKEAIGVGVVVAAVIAWCWPALTHGAILGSYDGVLGFGLGQGLFAQTHNLINGDQAQQDVVWLTLAYQAVHHLQLPLWNQYNGLGIPLLFNFQSAGLSLPHLVAYLAPLPEAYAVDVVVTLVLAGCGTYFAARAFGCSVRGSTLAGLVGALGGSIAAWSGWPQAGAAAWSGWLLGLFYLEVSRPVRSWRVVVIALAVAFDIYAGFPEVLVIQAIALVVFLLVLRIVRALRRRPFVGASLRRLVAGIGAGLLLAAPLWLPGLQALHNAASWGRVSGNLPAVTMIGLLVAGWYGYPLTGSQWFGPENYYEIAGYLGVPAVFAAIASLLRRRRSSVVVALLVTSVVLFFLIFQLGPEHILAKLPLLHSIEFGRGFLVLLPVVGLLGGLGFDEVVRRRATGGPRDLLAVWAVLALLVVLTGDLVRRAFSNHTLTGAERSIRLHSLIWPVLLELLLAAWLAWPTIIRRALPGFRRTRLQRGTVLLVAQAAFLVAVGAPLNTWSSRFLPTNAAIQQLQSTVGDGLVALNGSSSPVTFSSLGILADLNALYGIHELSIYDAISPRSLRMAWVGVSSDPTDDAKAFSPQAPTFSPSVTTLAQAQLFGVAWILTGPGGWMGVPADAGTALTAALQAAHLPVSTVPQILGGLRLWAASTDLQVAFPPSSQASELGLLKWVEVNTGLVGQERIDFGAVVQAVPSNAQLGAALAAAIVTTPPTGIVAAGTVSNERLYHVVGEQTAQFGSTAQDQVVSDLRFVANNRAQVTVSAPVGAWMDVHVQASAGWLATADGRPVPVRTWQGAMLQVWVPAGTRTVQLEYWPRLLTLGILLAVTACTLLILLVVFEVRSTSRRNTGRRGTGRRRTGTDLPGAPVDEEPLRPLSPVPTSLT